MLYLLSRSFLLFMTALGYASPQSLMEQSHLSPFINDASDKNSFMLQQTPLSALKAAEWLNFVGTERGLDLSLTPLSQPVEGAQRFQIHLEGIPIKGSYLSLYQKSHSTYFIGAKLPKEDQVLDIPGQDNSQDLVWFPTNEGLTLAKVSYENEEPNGPTTKIYRSIDGQILEQETLAFDLEPEAQVFQDNQPLTSPSVVKLVGLEQSGFLDNSQFKVFGRDHEEPRVQLEAQGFFHDPIEDPLFFDQVQTYFNSFRIMEYFQSIGYSSTGIPIKIFTNTSLKNNARYLPGWEGTHPEVQLGVSASRSMRNLARDRDVIAHELAHHLIFQHIKTTKGQSGILHEGYADYLAYAMSGDPFLGESIIPGKPWLRKALIEGQFNLDNKSSKYLQGSLWAGFLWKLRKRQDPHKFDKIVVRSLDYLNPEANFLDAILGLVWADAEVYPTLDEHGRGKHFCLLIEESHAMGLHQLIANWNTSICEDYEPKLQNPSPPPRKKPDAKTCGTIRYPGTSQGSMIILFLLPVILGLRRRRA